MNLQGMIERRRIRNDGQTELGLLGPCGLAIGKGIAKRGIPYRTDHQDFR
jgi:hypothetical protein